MGDHTGKEVVVQVLSSCNHHNHEDVEAAAPLRNLADPSWARVDAENLCQEVEAEADSHSTSHLGEGIAQVDHSLEEEEEVSNP
jgi:hypothetical protein